MESTLENAQLVFRALAEFGAPLAGMNPAELAQPDVIYQLGMPPARIDVLTSITGVDFAHAWGRKTVASFGELQAFFINARDLIQNKARPTPYGSDRLRLVGTSKRIPVGEPSDDPPRLSQAVSANLLQASRQ